MVKVMCKVCGSTGYTAASDRVICKCGGKFKVVPEKIQRKAVIGVTEKFNFTDYSYFAN